MLERKFVDFIFGQGMFCTIKIFEFQIDCISRIKRNESKLPKMSKEYRNEFRKDTIGENVSQETFSMKDYYYIRVHIGYYMGHKMGCFFPMVVVFILPRNSEQRTNGKTHPTSYLMTKWCSPMINSGFLCSH